MRVCTFFGHRNCPDTIKPALRAAIEKLITEHEADTFYAGNHGGFDACVRSTLRQLQREHPHIRYAVVLAYLPTGNNQFQNSSDTMFPEGLEVGPPQFAIARRNKWLLNQADHVICYIQHSWGGAYKFAKSAKQRGINVINLCDSPVLQSE